MSVIDKIQINSTTYDVAAGAGNVAYSDAATYPDGSAGKEISQLKSEIVDLKKGISGVYNVSLLSAFQRGSINTSTGEVVPSGYDYRVVSTDTFTFTSATKVTIASGFRIAYALFDDGSFDSFHNWYTGSYTFSVNSTVRLMITRTTEDSSEKANIKEFTDAVSYEGAINFIENDINAIESDVSAAQTEILLLKNAVEENADKINDLSPVDYGYGYSSFVYPSGFDGTFKPVTVFYDGHKFFTDYNKISFRNGTAQSATIHVTPDGSVSNNGSTLALATTFAHAIDIASAGDTVLVHDGIYEMSASEYRITKAINVIGDGNPVFCLNGTLVTPTYDSTSQLYKYTGSGTFLTAILKDNLNMALVKVDSLANCTARPYSWFPDSGACYFNIPSSMQIILLVTRSRGLILQNAGSVGSTLKIYLENLTIIGSEDSIFTSQYAGRIIYSVLDNVRILHSLGTAIHANGGRFLANKCACVYGRGDGFQYMIGRDSNNDPEPTEFVEIDCVGANNGVGTAFDSINGSTAHDVDKGIRINGKYYNNMGGNCTDVGTTTMTVNLGCTADNSCGSSHNEGFSVQSSGTNMWLYNCSANGNDADLQSETGCYIYTHDCDFETTRGNGTVTEITYP